MARIAEFFVSRDGSSPAREVVVGERFYLVARVEDPGDGGAEVCFGVVPGSSGPLGREYTLGCARASEDGRAVLEHVFDSPFVGGGDDRRLVGCHRNAFTAVVRGEGGRAVYHAWVSMKTRISVEADVQGLEALVRGRLEYYDGSSWRGLDGALVRIRVSNYRGEVAYLAFTRGGGYFSRRVRGLVRGSNTITAEYPGTSEGGGGNPPGSNGVEPTAVILERAADISALLAGLAGLGLAYLYERGGE